MRKRVVNKGYNVSRYPFEIGRYYMIKHRKDKPNPIRHTLLKTSNKRMIEDGISTLKYEINSLFKNILFTKFLVSYNQNEIVKNVNFTIIKANTTKIKKTTIKKTTRKG